MQVGPPVEMIFKQDRSHSSTHPFISPFIHLHPTCYNPTIAFTVEKYIYFSLFKKLYCDDITKALKTHISLLSHTSVPISPVRILLNSLLPLICTDLFMCYFIWCFVNSLIQPLPSLSLSILHFSFTCFSLTLPLFFQHPVRGMNGCRGNCLLQ